MNLRCPFNSIQSFVVVALAITCARSVEAASPIVIALPEEVTVDTREVQLLDIMENVDSDPKSRVIFRDIDISQIGERETGVVVRKSFVRIRLMLAGWKESDFFITGPEAVLINYRQPPPITDIDVEAAAVEVFARSSGRAAEDFRVRLSRPLISSLPATMQPLSDVQIDVAPPLQSGLGRMSTKVRLWKGNRLITSRPVRFEVAQKHRVAVLRVSRSRGDTLRATDIQFENRFVDSAVDEPSEQDVVGQRLRNNKTAGDIISLLDLDSPTPQRREQVVSARDKVVVTALAGPLRIQLRNAQAIESGRVGDIVKIRNLDSDKEIAARVAGPGAVEIRLR